MTAPNALFPEDSTTGRMQRLCNEPGQVFTQGSSFLVLPLHGGLALGKMVFGAPKLLFHICLSSLAPDIREKTFSSQKPMQDATKLSSVLSTPSDWVPSNWRGFCLFLSSGGHETLLYTCGVRHTPICNYVLQVSIASGCGWRGSRCQNLQAVGGSGVEGSRDHLNKSLP